MPNIGTVNQGIMCLTEGRIGVFGLELLTVYVNMD